MNWIVSELFYPDEVSTAKILTDIALKKLTQGDVSVICGPSGYEKSYNTQKNEFDSRIKIYRIGLPTLNKNRIFQRILRLLLLTFKMSWIIFFRVKKKDNLFLTTNPTFLILTTALLKKIKGFNLEILVHDVFPENLVPAGLIKNDSLKYRVLSKVYNLSYQKADRIIVLGEDMKQLMHHKTLPKTKRIDIIPNWADNDIHPVNNFDISSYLGIDVQDKIVFGFAGNLGRVQGVLEFIDLIKRSGNDNIVLIIIGDGALRLAVVDKINKENLQNVHYLGTRPRSEQNLFLNACHIGVVTLMSGMKGLGVPSKSYNIMAAGKPIFFIGDKNSEIDNYISKYSCGWSFTWEDENEMLKMLKRLSVNELTDVFNKGERSRNASENYKKDKVLNLF